MPTPPEKAPKAWTRPFFLAIGFLSVGLGFIGIFLPLLPTTPFLLLAAGCFMRSSPKFYHWLVEHPVLGPYVKGYLSGQGIPLKAKIYTLILLWSMMSISIIFIVPVLIGKLTLVIIATAVSIYLWRLPTYRSPESDS